MPMVGVLEVHIPAPEAQLPRPQALDPIPWSGIQMVPGLVPLVGGRS